MPSIRIGVVVGCRSALCEALNWRTASGQLKDMSARLLLNKLADRGLIKLPPRQRGGGRQILRALSEPELFSLSAGGGDCIEGPLRTLQPLEVIRVEPRTIQCSADQGAKRRHVILKLSQQNRRGVT